MRPQNAPSRGRGCLSEFANHSRCARVRVPFSAPKQEGRIRKVLPFFFCMPVYEGLGTCDLKTPLLGVGGVCQYSRKHSRCARVRVPFSAPKEGRIRKVLPSFRVFLHAANSLPSASATSKHSAKERDKKNKRRDCAVQTRPAHNVRHVIRAKAQKQTFLSRDSPYLSQFYQISIPRLYLIEILHQTTTTFVMGSLTFWLYLIEILHQTTTT